MRNLPLIRAVAAIALVAGLTAPALAEKAIFLNGLYCGAFCQAWLGIDRPAIRDDPLSRGGYTATIDSDKKLRKHSFATHHPSRRPHREDNGEDAVDVPALDLHVLQSDVPPLEAAPPETKVRRDAKKTRAARVKSAPTALLPVPRPPLDEPTLDKPALASPQPSAPAVDQKPAEEPSAALKPPPATDAKPSEPDVAGDSSSGRKGGVEAAAPAERPPESAAPGPDVASHVDQEPTGSIAKSDPSEPVAAPTPPPQPAAPEPPKQDVARAAPDVAKAPSADPATPGRVSPAVLIILAGPGVTSLEDLNNKPVVIAGVPSLSPAEANAAFVAAGASAVQLRAGSTDDIGQLVEGKVSAAIVAVLAPADASNFSEIPPYKLFRVVVSDHGVE